MGQRFTAAPSVISDTSASSAGTNLTAGTDHTVFKAALRKRLVHFNVEDIQSVWKLFGGHEDQTLFLDLWLSMVFQPAVSDIDRGALRLVVACDMSFFEVAVTGKIKRMIPLASAFLKSYTASMTPLEHMTDLISLIIDKEAKEVAEKITFDRKEQERGYQEAREAAEKTRVIRKEQEHVTLWCRLKRIQTDLPTADFGYSIEHSFSWLEADLLMPPCGDQDLLREQAEGMLLTPTSFSSSLFTHQPEKSLQVTIPGTSTESLISGLFFFKALGFTKPEDTTIHIMLDAEADGCAVIAAMGPKGLTRLSLRMKSVRHSVVKTLALSVYQQIQMKKLSEIITHFEGIEPDLLDFCAEPKGYSCYVGYTL